MIEADPQDTRVALVAGKSVQLDTYALMLGVDRRDLVNDDLGVFAETAQSLAEATRRSMRDDFARTLLNSATFFTSGNGNLATTGSALSATSLAAGMASMAKRKNAEGQTIDMAAVTLLVPEELKFTAQQLINSSEVSRAASGDQQATGNPLFRSLNIVSEARLSDSTFTGYSASQWFLFAPPIKGAMYIALLNDKDTPQIQQEDQPFHRLGLMWRVVMDWDFALGEPAAAYKATGAA